MYPHSNLPAIAYTLSSLRGFLSIHCRACRQPSEYRDNCHGHEQFEQSERLSPCRLDPLLVHGFYWVERITSGPAIEADSRSISPRTRVQGEIQSPTDGCLYNLTLEYQGEVL